ncbi:arsenate reductase ArsC [Rheinheimera soli]|uniref:arsenate reductase ArsC n=1 Tax=Rheinheimera soli TaxID=443616 RepID=UPI001E499A4F|nr:arsenate reductase ArsC [Rheinheimera soli]
MNILFLCTHNSCRSILAEAITRHLVVQQGDNSAVMVASAGSSPRGFVHPLTLQYLSQWSVDTKNLQSKSWDHLTDFNPDLVITVCDQAAGESCPVWFGRAVKGHWGLPDPTRAGLSPAQIDSEFNLLFDVLIKRCEALIQLKQPDPSAVATIALSYPL